MRRPADGVYPATDGTSIWADAELPPAGEHYWECVFRCPPEVGASKGSALRGGFLIGVAKSTYTILNDDDDLEEVPRDCAGKQYIFRLPGAWGMEDSSCTNGGPLRADGEAHGGTANHLGSRTWPMAPRLRNDSDFRYYRIDEFVLKMMNFVLKMMDVYGNGQGTTERKYTRTLITT